MQEQNFCILVGVGFIPYSLFHSNNRLLKSTIILPSSSRIQEHLKLKRHTRVLPSSHLKLKRQYKNTPKQSPEIKETIQEHSQVVVFGFSKVIPNQKLSPKHKIILREFNGKFYNFQPRIDLAGGELVIKPEGVIPCLKYYSRRLNYRSIIRNFLYKAKAWLFIQHIVCYDKLITSCRNGFVAS